MSKTKRKRERSTSTSSVREVEKKKKKSSIKKKKDSKKKKRRRSPSSDTSDSSASSVCSSLSSSSSSNEAKKRKKKLKKKEKKIKHGKSKKHKTTKETVMVGSSVQVEDMVGPSVPAELSSSTERPRMAPMTKEEWEKKQSVVRRVYDEETGRHRLIKGDGEVLEEIVSRDRHKEINRQATMGDGMYFQSKLPQR